jgi:transposase
MSYLVPRFLRFEGFNTVDVRTSFRDKTTQVYLETRYDKPLICHVCRSEMTRVIHKKHRKVRDLDIRGFEFTIHFSRRTGECPTCLKQRVEYIHFISPLSPHYSREFSWSVGELCEFSAVSRAAKYNDIDNMTLRRIDHSRMHMMAKHYVIPKVTGIAVDEVYARRKSHYKNESRNRKFFTVITDIKERKVIWVSKSRNKSALDEFFSIIGPEACKEIEVAAIDQHDAYKASIEEHCPNAVVVWDRFHLVSNFEDAVNETRKDLHANFSNKDPLFQLTRGKYRTLFQKRAERRSKEEKRHIDDILKEDADFAQLEMIKEKMLDFFNQADEESAKEVFKEVGDWIWQKGFRPLMRWYKELEKGWSTLTNYFKYRVTTAVSEGINNVIKALKRQGFGYRNMDYFRLKIMQKCGYLNSEYMPNLIWD